MVCIRQWLGSETALVGRLRPRVRRRERGRDDDYLTARCPRCRGWLIARQINGRPGFACRCVSKD
ncbi:MAG: hypothetical protein FJ271_11810 [Planctomycetes bacterium]|nr:hypothetical protein [Planctomycetota bacterium]